MLGIIEHKQPDRIRLQANAGRFNFSFNNAKNRFWIFPAGTVLYSDGVTAIATSTAQQPDVTIPVGGGDVWLRANFGGNFSMNDNNTDAGYVGALADLQGKITYFLDLANCAHVTGDLSDLQGKITYFLRLINCANVTGDLSDLQGKITYFLDLFNCAHVTGDLSDLQGKITHYLDLSNCANVTGDLSDLQGKITYYLNLFNCAHVTGDLSDLQGKITYLLSLSNCANVTGGLSDLQGKITYYLNLLNCAHVTGDLADLQGKITTSLILYNCANVTGVYTPVGAGTPTITALSNTGLSATDMDNTLIAYAAATKNNGSFTATGMTRTAASDAAVATLTGRGWTISGITKV